MKSLLAIYKKDLRGMFMGATAYFFNRCFSNYKWTISMGI